MVYGSTTQAMGEKTRLDNCPFLRTIAPLAHSYAGHKETVMAKKKKPKKSTKRTQKAPDLVGDFLKGLQKRNKGGEIRGVLAIVIGREAGQNQLQWAGQVTPGEVALPIATAERIFVDMALNQGKQQA